MNFSDQNIIYNIYSSVPGPRSTVCRLENDTSLHSLPQTEACMGHNVCIHHEVVGSRQECSGSCDERSMRESLAALEARRILGLGVGVPQVSTIIYCAG